MVKKKKRRGDNVSTWVLFGCIGLVVSGIVLFVIKVVTTDIGPRRKNNITNIALLRPPPPVKEKLPEPEIPKVQPKQSVEQVIETPQNAPQDSPQDNTPAGADLGVEGEGGAGSDGFGLVGKGKGGRSIIGGGTGVGSAGRLSLLAKYGWYTKKIQDEIRVQVKKRLDLDGGFPKGKYQTLVKITLDSKGTVIEYRIVGPSGNDRMDKAVRETVSAIRMTEAPPAGMPSGMTIKISSQG
jgi:TonB family protein